MTMERVLWFDERVRAGHHPGSAAIAARFKVSARTARRDIEFLRDRLQAPLRYDAAAKGYAYSDPGFYLPQSFFRKEEMIALLFARHLFRGLAPPLKEEAAAVSGRLDELFRGTPLGKAEEAVSFDFFRGAETSEKVYFDLLRAIILRRMVRLHYAASVQVGPGDREIEPLKLHFSLGAWHLIGVSRHRKGIWRCPVSRIRRVEVTARQFVPPKKLPVASLAARRGVRGGTVRNARIRFGAGRTAWASAQQWHPKGRLQLELDGSAVLELPEARFLEILGLVLQLGGDAFVASPRDLRDRVQSEVDRLAAVHPERDATRRR